MTDIEIRNTGDEWQMFIASERGRAWLDDNGVSGSPAIGGTCGVPPARIKDLIAWCREDKVVVDDTTNITDFVFKDEGDFFFVFVGTNQARMWMDRMTRTSGRSKHAIDATMVDQVTGMMHTAGFTTEEG